MSIRLLKSVILSGLMCSATLADQRIVIHEWGTFTSLQNDKGEAIGGINVDTELLPAFVHNFAPAILPNQAPIFAKGMPSARPRLDVTMRLETPVVYFHLPKGAPRPTALDLSVRFQNGWLTQFYPDAVADIDHQPVGKQPLGFMTSAKTATSGRSASTGGLAWRNLRIGTNASGPAEKSRVWLAPREVQSDAVTTEHGESEKYLFYRGVGNLDAPLRVSHLIEDKLEIRATSDLISKAASAIISRLWLVDVTSEGSLAFRAVGPLPIRESASPLRVAAVFSAADHSADALASLRVELRQALVVDGLFADEADALLNTWEQSYFRQQGLRLFFLVPRAWTDAFLPMNVSVPCTIHRSMVGRIELVSPQQRKTIRQLAAVNPDLPEKNYYSECNRLYSGLGRFANALLLDEQKNHPNEGLATYIRRAKLGSYAPPVSGQVSAR